LTKSRYGRAPRLTGTRRRPRRVRSESAPTFSALRPLIRVQIISDNRLLRDSLARELDARDEFSVVGVSGGFAAPGMARGAHPEVAVLDATATAADVVRAVIDGSP